MQSSYVPLLDAGGAAATSSPAVAEKVMVSTVDATAVATGHLMLKLEGYSLLKAMHGDNGSYIESPSFEVGGHAWKIRCYLNGENDKVTGYVSLFLHLCDHDAAAGPAVHAEYELALVRHHVTTPPALSKTSKGVLTFGGKDGNLGWGHSWFIGVKELERSEFLKEDCLAVRCTVTVVRERTVKEKAVRAEDMARLGMLCKCDDDLCKRHHDRPAQTLLERFAKLCHYICRRPV